MLVCLSHIVNMTSVVTRHSIALYELQFNALLSAVKVGGALHLSCPPGHYEAFLVPRQVSLQAYQLDTVLKLAGNPGASVEDVETLRSPRHIDPTKLDESASGSLPTPRAEVPLVTQVTPDQQNDLLAILSDFLSYHVIHFHEAANSRFTTAKGDSGEFSEALDRVKLFRSGKEVVVVSDSNAVEPASSATEPLDHPLKLPLFILEEPLMSASDLAAMTREICRVLSCDAISSLPPQSSNPQKKAVVTGTLCATGFSLAHSPFSAEQDVIVEEDLTPFISKTPRQMQPDSEQRHVNLLTHIYSKESVCDYRNAVAVDNEIQYKVFEDLMGTAPCESLVRILCSYVESVQRGELSLLNADRYGYFRYHCNTEIDSIVHRMQMTYRSILTEGVEKYVTTKLFSKIFHAVCESSSSVTAQLQERWKQCAHFTAENLDALPEVERHHVWGQAMFELDGMNFFKTPRDKLRCGMRACELLSLAVGDILRQRKAVKAAVAGSSPPQPSSPASSPSVFGADEFLPCFMLLVLRAQPHNFHPNCAYIEAYRYASLMTPEETYTLATMQSALAFWANCNTEGWMEGSRASTAGAERKRRNTDKHVMPSIPAPILCTGHLLSTSTSARRTSSNVPTLRQEDLLPSVQRARTILPASSVATAVTHLSTGKYNRPVEHAPTLMDTLFSWTTHATVPSPTTSVAYLKAVENRKPAGPPPPRPPPPFNETANSEIPDKTQAENTEHRVCITTGVPTTLQLPANSAIWTLLRDQGKSFEALTFSELRSIVEELQQLIN